MRGHGAENGAAAFHLINHPKIRGRNEAGEGEVPSPLSLLPSLGCRWLPRRGLAHCARRPEPLAKITLSSAGVRGLARRGGQGRKAEGRGVRVGSFAGQMTYTTLWLPVPEKGQKSGGGDGNHFFRIVTPFGPGGGGQGARLGKGSTELVRGVPAQGARQGLGVGAPTCSWLEQPYWMSGVKVVSCSSASVCSSCPTRLGILVTL